MNPAKKEMITSRQPSVLRSGNRGDPNPPAPNDTRGSGCSHTAVHVALVPSSQLVNGDAATAPRLLYL